MEPGKQHTALVISPLNALMDNQVSTWRQRNIKCIALHSNLEAGIAEIKANHYSIVFTSPELVLSAKFRSQFAFHHNPPFFFLTTVRVVPNLFVSKTCAHVIPDVYNAHTNQHIA